MVQTSVSFCLVSVSMFCPFMRVRCWNLPLLLCDVKYVLWALVKFFYECEYPCIWSIYVQNWEFLVDFSLDEYEMPYLNFLITFGWKSILFDIRMAIPACFLELFPWKIVFFEVVCLSLSLRWLSCIPQTVGSFICIQYVSLFY